MSGSNLFLMLLEHLVLLYFQVCSNSAYPQGSSEWYRTSGPLVLVLWWGGSRIQLHHVWSPITSHCFVVITRRRREHHYQSMQDSQAKVLCHNNPHQYPQLAWECPWVSYTFCFQVCFHIFFFLFCPKKFRVDKIICALVIRFNSYEKQVV